MCCSSWFDEVSNVLRSTFTRNSLAEFIGLRRILQNYSNSNSLVFFLVRLVIHVYMFFFESDRSHWILIRALKPSREENNSKVIFLDHQNTHYFRGSPFQVAEILHLEYGGFFFLIWRFGQRHVWKCIFWIKMLLKGGVRQWHLTIERCGQILGHGLSTGEGLKG